MTGQTLQLSTAQIDTAQSQANAIATAKVTATKSGQFVFFAAFDGTDNALSPNVAGDPQNTAVAQLYSQAFTDRSALLVPKYYPGVGTPGTILGSDGIPSSLVPQSIATATKAYNDFALAAYNYLTANPTGSVTSMITAFSRGGAAAAIFSQMLYEKGLVYKGQVLIPPGTAGAVSNALIIDPVDTGETGNMNFIPHAQNVTVVQAQNEYRQLFRAEPYTGDNVNILLVTGNHGDAGDIYDNGLGGMYLQAYTSYFKNAGLNIAPIDPTRAYVAGNPVVVHSESVASPGQILLLWDLQIQAANDNEVRYRLPLVC